MHFQLVDMLGNDYANSIWECAVEDGRTNVKKPSPSDPVV
jgi:hypothetical protein